MNEFEERINQLIELEIRLPCEVRIKPPVRSDYHSIGVCTPKPLQEGDTAYFKNLRYVTYLYVDHINSTELERYALNNYVKNLWGLNW